MDFKQPNLIETTSDIRCNSPITMSTTDEGFHIALEEAREGLSEGGLPIGSAIIAPDGSLLGRGRNMRSVNIPLHMSRDADKSCRMQNGSPILHVCTDR